jgi:hypothetical protein
MIDLVLFFNSRSSIFLPDVTVPHPRYLFQIEQIIQHLDNKNTGFERNSDIFDASLSNLSVKKSTRDARNKFCSMSYPAI